MTKNKPAHMKYDQFNRIISI